MPSTYFSRLRSAVRRSGIGQEGVLQEFKSRVEQGKFRFCNYRLFHPVCVASLTDLQLLLSPDAVIASSSDSILVNRRRKISVVGALPRTFSLPSVSGPSFQGCGYHIDRALCDNYQISVSGKSYDDKMAVSASRAVLGECILENLTSRGGHLPLPENNHNISFGSSSQSFRKDSMILKNREQPTNSPFDGFCTNNAAKRWCNFSPYMESGLREFHCSSHPCFAAGTASDVTYENSTREEQLEGCASSEQYVLRPFHRSLIYFHDISFQNLSYILPLFHDFFCFPGVFNSDRRLCLVNMLLTLSVQCCLFLYCDC